MWYAAGMAKKKSTSGKNVTPRVAIQMPKDWHGVAKKCANSRRQILVWFLISLIQEIATKDGVRDLPRAPWEEGEGDK